VAPHLMAEKLKRAIVLFDGSSWLLRFCAGA